MKMENILLLNAANANVVHPLMSGIKDSLAHQMRRRRDKVDANQQAIVDALRAIPGVTVETGHDDILVGYNGLTRWYEVKDPSTISKITGEVRESELKPSQRRLKNQWRGHYKIVWSLEQILQDIGLSSG